MVAESNDLLCQINHITLHHSLRPIGQCWIRNLAYLELSVHTVAPALVCLLWVGFKGVKQVKYQLQALYNSTAKISQDYSHLLHEFKKEKHVSEIFSVCYMLQTIGKTPVCLNHCCSYNHLLHQIHTWMKTYPLNILYAESRSDNSKRFNHFRWKGSILLRLF